MFVVVVVVAMVVGRPWDPIRRAEGSAVLRSAHCCGGGCEGGAGGAVSKGLGLWERFWRGERGTAAGKKTRPRGEEEKVKDDKSPDP